MHAYVVVFFLYETYISSNGTMLPRGNKSQNLSKLKKKKKEKLLYESLPDAVHVNALQRGSIR